MGGVSMGVSLLLVAQLAAGAVAPLDLSLATEAACSDGQRFASSGFAPLSNGAQRTVEGAGWGCYRLFLNPGAPFTGTLRVELRDSVGRVAFAEYEAVATGVVPPFVLPFRYAESTPPLLLDDNMRLTVVVTPTDQLGPQLPAAVGQWEAGVVFGQA